MPVRFLIADDVPAQQKLLANVVLFLGGESRFASNGREALRLAQEELFDIVLLDLSMPELGGVAAADRLIDTWSSLHHRPRVVAVTGETDEGSRTLCRAVGMDGFIAKPFGVGTVRKALKQLITKGHCWPEGAARRILHVDTLDPDHLQRDSQFDREVLEARTVLQELVEKSESLTPEQRTDKAAHLTSFARKHGLLLLAPLMEAFTKASRDGKPDSLAAQLAAQRADFEHAIIALRAWRHHAPEPMRLSA